MEIFVKGDIVVVPFPFTDLTGSTKRPALIITNLKGDDLISCQITSQNRIDKYSISLRDDDFVKGRLRFSINNIRPNRIFTIDKNIIIYKIGSIKKKKMKEVIDKIIQIIKS